jgi:nucleotide-binding universal stress UspA family protein
MYKKILVPLDNSNTDKVIIDHIRKLARLMNSEIIFIHVADGFMARNQRDLGESDEMRSDYRYLKECENELLTDGYNVRSILRYGEPYKEILSVAESEKCDLIAMATHGHRYLNDIILGSVATEVRHGTHIPVLQIKA